MKTINVLLFFILCSFATTNAQAETKPDCSQVKKLHEKLLCKAGKTTSYAENGFPSDHLTSFRVSIIRTLFFFFHFSNVFLIFLIF